MADSDGRTGTVSSIGINRGPDSEPTPLGIYLNDHLAGATSGLELARRAARSQRGSAAGDVLERLASEIAQDRTALLDMISALGLPARQYKVYTGWAMEKVARLKLNGQLLRNSPLRTVIELESLRLGVEGKAMAWRTLRAVAERDARLDAAQLDQLVGRARRQEDDLEGLRMDTVRRHL
ncbi:MULTISPECIES: hypothetical protein [unclassified Frankia]|uniref:hypothetical protein n=1 Tax=unclassified Frankia TaxID=2632575 RepID=UPI002AD30C99|nr:MULTISPECIES: hypothetical protein [unclassified Frankia]